MEDSITYVYAIVECFDYAGCETLKVFSTKESAEAWLKSHSLESHLNIEQWKVD